VAWGWKLALFLANNIVILYPPQSGGFLERGEKGPSDQLTGGCFDGYGQTRDDFAYSTGAQKHDYGPATFITINYLTKESNNSLSRGR